MRSYTKQRAERNRLRFSRMGKASQAAQQARRDAQMPERIRELEAIEAENLPRNHGDILGSFQWTDARTGKARRWIVRIGSRRDQITLEAPGGKPTASHGWAWAMTQLRKHLCHKQ